MKRVAFLICIFLISLGYLSGQAGIILYAEGEEFTIQKGDTIRTLHTFYDDVIGITLEEGDVISTFNSTFLEIQLLPGQNILKIAENTTFTLTGLTPQGGGSFDVAYGRVRAKVDKLLHGDRFQVRTEAAVAGVRGTDFGVDVIVNPESDSSEAEVQVYCFEGEVAVASLSPGQSGDQAIIDSVLEDSSVLVQENQIVSLERTSIPETESIPQNVIEYWKDQDFEATPVKNAEEVLEQIETQEIDKIDLTPSIDFGLETPDPLDVPELEDDNTLVVIGGTVLGIGAGLGATAIILNSNQVNPDLEKIMAYSSVGLMSGGAIIILFHFVAQ